MTFSQNKLEDSCKPQWIALVHSSAVYVPNTVYLRGDLSLIPSRVQDNTAYSLQIQQGLSVHAKNFVCQWLYKLTNRAKYGGGMQEGRGKRAQEGTGSEKSSHFNWNAHHTNTHTHTHTNTHHKQTDRHTHTHNRRTMDFGQTGVIQSEAQQISVAMCVCVCVCVCVFVCMCVCVCVCGCV